ncbi:RNA methyltransferase [Gelidibacter maritimus]|uniref:RNA methyltransferase n=1 Tax=Gelidibacter maritimus TaxID=2761487 RepID=A0A7W2M639_9FLAO|nr:RNA methyltransferase [Gelidibacter maritimus]MBA6153365.1 RNA methyltransferase [Gelidibacter maritimus]
MLTKNQIKIIASLGQKKQRLKHRLFRVEGKKAVDEFLKSHFKLHGIYALTRGDYNVPSEKFYTVTEPELKKMSALTTPQQVVAVFEIPNEEKVATDTLILALDAIRDPGNLGTIIRLCDWFGIEHLVCSETTVDCYNPKVVQATMGSLTRVNVRYLNLETFLKTTKVQKLGAFMDGHSIYEKVLPKQGILIMGNEANGISPEIEVLIENRLGIPHFSKHQETESLNVATATAILLSEFKRRG